MSAYFNVNGRREFLKAAVAASVLPLTAVARAAEETEEQRTAWYRRAKFGMFIHWGPYSLASVEASWPIMRPAPGGITEAEYRALPKRFNPTQFDPHAWVELARAAGQRYMVFTPSIMTASAPRARGERFACAPLSIVCNKGNA